MSELVYFESLTEQDASICASAIEHLFTQLPDSALPKPGMRVLLKPNLLAKHPPSHAVTTHPDVVRGVILALQKRGIFDIGLLDSPGGTHTTLGMQNIFRVCGIHTVCQELNVHLYADANGVDFSCPNGHLVRQFTVLKAVTEADYILNLPKLKTHVLTGMSGACKNLFGCVPGLLKAEFHMRFPERAQFGQMLVDLCEGIKPNLHLMDGILSMEGDGPAGGTARFTGLILASQNPHLLDLAVCHLIGLSPQSVPNLAVAIEKELCPAQFHANHWQANTPNVPLPFEDFRLPSSISQSMDFSTRVPTLLQNIFSYFAAHTTPRPLVQAKKCILCKKCADICPADAIDLCATAAKIRKKECIRCFCCHEICPVKAISIHKSPLFRL